MASEDARYRETTQFKHWSFTREELAIMRSQISASARTAIVERLRSSSNPPSNGHSAPNSNKNTPDPEPSSQSQPSSLPEFLTPAEELMLLNNFISELLRAGEHLAVSPEVMATAAVLFKRFYLTNSILTYPPTDILLVALFFGSKAEGEFRDAQRYAEEFGTTKDDILAGEFIFCQGIRFDFDVKHPFRALEGAIMQLRKYKDLDDIRIQKSRSRAREILKFSPLMTDAYFHYPPSQIMLAALSLADRGLLERLIQETFHHVEPNTASGESTPVPNGDQKENSKPKSLADKERIIGAVMRDKVLGTIEACRDMLSKELPERKEYWTNKEVHKSVIKPVLRKLKKCRDPDSANFAALEKARRELAMKDAESDDEGDGNFGDDGAVFGETGGASNGAQRDAKRRKVQQEDPFGPAL